MKDLISRQAVLKLLAAMPPEEAMTKALLIQSVKQMDAAQPEVAKDTNVLTNDCISRQAVIDALRTHERKDSKIWFDNQLDIEWYNATDICCYDIEDLPSAQPERKKGRWLPDNRPGGGFWVCSECKFPSEAFAANVLYKFCPNCGADMREVDDERPD